MSGQAKHTPGVMHVGDLIDDTGSDWVGLYVARADGEDVVIADATSQDVPDEVCNANAERIAHCWNCHDELLASCKELRDALAGAMRVIVNYAGADTATQFEREMERVGITPGIGVRANAAIAKATEGAA